MAGCLAAVVGWTQPAAAYEPDGPYLKFAERNAAKIADEDRTIDTRIWGRSGKSAVCCNITGIMRGTTIGPT